MSWLLFQKDALNWLADQSAEQYDALVDPPYRSGGLHVGSRPVDSANGKYPEFSVEKRDPRAYQF